MHGQGDGVPHARKREPILKAPTAVTTLIAALILVYIVQILLPQEQSWALVTTLGLVPARVSEALSARPLSDLLALLSLLAPFVSHTFVHGGVLHLAFNSLWLLALGTPVALRLGTLRFIVLYFLAGILGAITYVLFYPESDVPVIGASGAISGLMGGVVRFTLIPSRSGRLVSLGDPRLLVFVALWFIINLVFGVTGLGVTDETTAIAWEAHLGGFIGGLVLFPLLDRTRARAPLSG